MEANQSSFKIKKKATSCFFWLSIIIIVGLTCFVFWQARESHGLVQECLESVNNTKTIQDCITQAKSSDPIRFFSVISFVISTITLIITNFYRKNEAKTLTAHTFYYQDNGSGSLVIHNTSEQALSIISLYLGMRPIHNSARTLLNIDSNKSIEVALTKSQLEGIKESTSKLLITTTIETIESKFFERPKRFGGDEILAIIKEEEEVKNESTV
jgi:preprotein translocase subunit SecG